jgi:hypothetical protein
VPACGQAAAAVAAFRWSGGGAGQAGANLISRGLGAMMKPEFQQTSSLSDIANLIAD